MFLEGGFDFVDDGANLVKFEEVASDDVGDEGGAGDEDEFREDDEEGVVGGHKGEEFGHGIGDAASNEGSEEAAPSIFPEGEVEHFVARAFLEDGEKDDDFEERADGLGPAETFRATANDGEADGEKDGEADGDDGDGKGSFGVLVSVETARGDMEDGGGENGDDKSGENGGDETVTTVFDEADDVATGEERDDGDRKGDPDDGRKGGAEGLAELFFVPFANFFSELREESGRNGDADEIYGHGGEVVGLLVGTQSASAHAGGEVGGDEGVDIVHSLVERAGGEEFEDGAEALIFPVNFKFVVKAEAEEPDEAHDDLENGAEDDAERNAHNAAIENLPAEDVDTFGEEEDADEDADIVERGGEGVEDEATEGLLDAGEDGGNGEKEGVDGDDAHHVNGENHTGLVETRANDVANKRVGEDDDEDGGDEGHERHEIEKTGAEFPSRFFVAFREALVEDGDERYSKGAGSKNEEKEVGDGEGGGVGVDAGRVGVEIERVQESIAEDAKQSGNEGRARQNDGGHADGEFAISTSNDRLKLH